MQNYIAKQYKIIKSKNAIVSGNIFRKSFLDSISSINEMLALADAERQTLIQLAINEQNAIKVDAAIQAQKEVWEQAFSCFTKLQDLEDEVLKKAEVVVMKTVQKVLEELLLLPPSPDWPISSSVRLILREWQGVQKGILILHPDDLKLIPEVLISNQLLDVISDSNQAQGSCKLSFGMSELHACFHSNIQALISVLEDKNNKDFNQEKELSYVE